METDLFKITLADGTSIENLRLNGNNFVSQTEITEDIFLDNLATVKIEGPDNADDAGLVGEHTHMELIQIAHYKDGWYFILRDIPQSDLEKLKTRADIEYIAMMTDVDLGDE